MPLSNFFTDQDPQAVQIQKVINGDKLSSNNEKEKSNSSEEEIESDDLAPLEVVPIYKSVHHKEPGPIERPFKLYAASHIYFLWYCTKHREYIFKVSTTKNKAYFLECTRNCRGSSEICAFSSRKIGSLR